MLVVFFESSDSHFVGTTCERTISKNNCERVVAVLVYDDEGYGGQKNSVSGTLEITSIGIRSFVKSKLKSSSEISIR